MYRFCLLEINIYSSNTTKVFLFNCLVIDVTKADLHETIMKATNGDGIARICEISGHAPTLAKCLKYLRKGGKLGLVGLPKSAVTFEDPLPDLIFKSLEIHSVHGRKIFHTWEECEKLIESGRVKPVLKTKKKYG